MKHIRNDKALKKIGKKIRVLRKEQNISQSQLSFEANVRVNQIGRIERGEINTSISTIIAIAEALNVKVKDLFDF